MTGKKQEREIDRELVDYLRPEEILIKAWSYNQHIQYVIRILSRRFQCRLGNDLKNVEIADHQMLIVTNCSITTNNPVKLFFKSL